MARKSSSTFRDRGNNGWGQKIHRQRKHEQTFQVVAILDLDKGGKMRFERVAIS